MNQRFPLFSRILLAPEPPGDVDGSLLASDIASAEFKGAEVVVLGTCDGASGPFVEGEGSISLARVFLSAGADAVVASLWPVDDAGSKLLTDFHAALRRSADPTSALRSAQLASLSRRRPLGALSAWAGFVVWQ